MSDDDKPNGAEGRLRVSNAERQAVVDALRVHTGDGRLGIDEFEERSEKAIAARTRDDLRGLLDDLPSEPSLDSPATTWAGAVPVWEPEPISPSTRRPLEGAVAGHSEVAGHHGAGYGDRHGGWYRHGWNGFVYLSLLLTAIWWMSGAGYFWPMWVIVPIGLGVLCSGSRTSRRRIGPTPPGAS
jgi:hypothetical protein